MTHIHTSHSWDSRVQPELLARRLHDRGVTLALVSDHDSFQGSLDVRRISAAEGLGLHVPVAAEIRTDCGDVIVAFEDEVQPDVATLKRWSDLYQEVRERGGLIWLPHPYRSHRHVDALAERADVVEVFNGRCTVEENRQATALCRRHGKVPGYGADSHLLREVGEWLIEYPTGQRLLDVFRSPPRCHDARRTSSSNVYVAEVINGVKRRRPTLVGYFALRYAQQRILEAVGRA